MFDRTIVVLLVTPCLGLSLLTAPTPSCASTEAVVYSFDPSAGDGGYPLDGLTNVGGTLFGTTYEGGGSANAGTVFSLNPATVGNGGYSLLHAFSGSDGALPPAGLINVGGSFYGVTSHGGGDGQCDGISGCGTFYSVTSGGALTVLHSFGAGSDAASPVGGLVKVGSHIYGTTRYGGLYGNGAVFSVTTKGAETVVYSFTGGTDGGSPEAALIDVNGTLYGTTYDGGANGYGTVYSISPAGIETVIYAFAGGSDGANPRSPLLNVSGTLYGTTQGGGTGSAGTVFTVSPSGSETVLHSFVGGTDGAAPVAGLVKVGGKFYGTTAFGGGTSDCYGGNGCGTVFSITPAGKETVLYAFAAGSDGANPEAGLVNLSGVLYGTTFQAGEFGGGTVYQFRP